MEILRFFWSWRDSFDATRMKFCDALDAMFVGISGVPDIRQEWIVSALVKFLPPPSPACSGILGALFKFGKYAARAHQESRPMSLNNGKMIRSSQVINALEGSIKFDSCSVDCFSFHDGFVTSERGLG